MGSFCWIKNKENNLPPHTHTLCDVPLWSVLLILHLQIHWYFLYPIREISSRGNLSLSPPVPLSKLTYISATPVECLWNKRNPTRMFVEIHCIERPLYDLFIILLLATFSMYQDDKISLLLQVETLEELCAKILIQLKVWFNIHTPTFFRERVIACSFYRISTHSLLHNFHKLVFSIPKASLTEEQIFQPPK